LGIVIGGGRLGIVIWNLEEERRRSEEKAWMCFCFYNIGRDKVKVKVCFYLRQFSPTDVKIR